MIRFQQNSTVTTSNSKHFAGSFEQVLILLSKQRTLKIRMRSAYKFFIKFVRTFILKKDHNYMKRALDEKSSNLNEVLNAIRKEFNEEIEKQNYENQKERDKLRLEIKELERFVVTAKQCGLIEVSINSEQ